MEIRDKINYKGLVCNSKPYPNKKAFNYQPPSGGDRKSSKATANLSYALRFKQLAYQFFKHHNLPLRLF